MTIVKLPAGTFLDPHLKAHRGGTRFELEDGTYYCGTGWAFDKDFDHVCLGPECELIGNGANRTIIELHAQPGNIPKGARQVEGFTCGVRSFRPAEGTSNTIRGVTFLLAESMASDYEDLGLIGLHAWSYRVTLDDVRVIGVQGNRKTGNEGFGILVNGVGENGKRTGGGSRITNCRVYARKGYVCGVYVGYDVPVLPSSVSDVIVGFTPMASEEVAHAAFGTNGGVFWSELRNIGRWERAVFCDTGGGQGTLISNSRLQAERVLVEFRGCSGMAWRDIVIQDSILETTPLAGRKYAAGLVLACDGPAPGATFENVLIRGCTMRSSGGLHYVGSVDVPGASACGIHAGNLIGTWEPPVISGGVTSYGFREFGVLRA